VPVQQLVWAVVNEQILARDPFHLEQRLLGRKGEIFPLPRPEATLRDHPKLLGHALPMQFEFAKPFPPDRACSAAACDAPSGRRQVIDQIVKMRVLLEVIASAIRNDTSFDNVNFAD
jgi:hypothetical protein